MTIRILHFSDSHEDARFSMRALFDKRIFGYVNSRIVRRGRYDAARLDDAVGYILETKPDLAVFTGDAVSTSDPREFERAFEHFRPLIDHSVPLLCVQGNHDLYVRDSACGAAMEDFYRKLDAHSPGGAPHLLNIRGIRFVIAHCAKPTGRFFSSGRMTEETAEFLETEANRTDETSPLVCVNHFPVLEGSSLLNFRRRLYGADTVRKLLESGRIALSLCGHIHRGFAVRRTDGSLAEICAGSVTKYGTFAEIDYDPERGIFSGKRLLANEKHIEETVL